MKTGLDFKLAVEANNIDEWHIHSCSLCNYNCGYRFINGDVFYDNGCYCTSGKNLNPRTWEDVAEQYNMQTHPDVIERMNKVFNF